MEVGNLRAVKRKRILFHSRGLSDKQATITSPQASPDWHRWPLRRHSDCFFEFVDLCVGPNLRDFYKDWLLDPELLLVSWMPHDAELWYLGTGEWRFLLKSGGSFYFLCLLRSQRSIKYMLMYKVEELKSLEAIFTRLKDGHLCLNGCHFQLTLVGDYTKDCQQNSRDESSQDGSNGDPNSRCEDGSEGSGECGTSTESNEEDRDASYSDKKEVEHVKYFDDEGRELKPLDNDDCACDLGYESEGTLYHDFEEYEPKVPDL